LFAFLRKENYGIFGVEDGQTISDEKKMEPVAFRSIEQENTPRRDFIIHVLSQASDDSLKSKLLLEFAALHFPDKVAETKRQCNEAYRKKHERIEERIRELQPYNGENAEEDVTETEILEPDTFDDPDTDNVPLYPGLPEHAEIGERPDDDTEITEATHKETAA
jgi:ParB family chromosome partitioning protein